MTQTVRNKHFRAVNNKFVRLGYSYEISEAYSHSPELLRNTAAVSREWLGGRGRKERGFALGSYSHEYMRRSRLHLLYDSDHRLVAFANEIPSYNSKQATIDLMRHRRQSETGAMDYMFLCMIKYYFESGIPEFSLGIAPLSGLNNKSSSPIEQKFLHYIAAVGFGTFSYEGLRRYKNKFEPRWESRYMAYGSGPEGFLRSGAALNTLIN